MHHRLADPTSKKISSSTEIKIINERILIIKNIHACLYHFLVMITDLKTRQLLFDLLHGHYYHYYYYYCELLILTVPTD